MEEKNYVLDINDCFPWDFSWAADLSIDEVGKIFSKYADGELKNPRKNKPQITQQNLDKSAKIL